MIMTPLPVAQIIEPADLRLEEVAAAVEGTRAIARARGKSVLAWWITPDQDAYTPHLEALGLVNEDSPGLKAIEHAMALLTQPARAERGIEVKQVESLDEFVGAARVSLEAFQVPIQMREEMEAGLAQRYEEYTDPRYPGRSFIALLDGRIVGTATAVAGNAGVNLYGGSVRVEARGRGVYRALLRARWDFAVQRGTPALTVQAGRMSKPILEAPRLRPSRLHPHLRRHAPDLNRPLTRTSSSSRNAFRPTTHQPGRKDRAYFANAGAADGCPGRRSR